VRAGRGGGGGGDLDRGDERSAVRALRAALAGRLRRLARRGLRGIRLEGGGLAAAGAPLEGDGRRGRADGGRDRPRPLAPRACDRARVPTVRGLRRRLLPRARPGVRRRLRRLRPDDHGLRRRPLPAPPAALRDARRIPSALGLALAAELVPAVPAGTAPGRLPAGDRLHRGLLSSVLVALETSLRA